MESGTSPKWALQQIVASAGFVSESDVQALIGAMTPADIGAAAAGHSHVIGDVTNLQTSLDGKAPLAGAVFTGAVGLPAGSAGSPAVHGPHSGTGMHFPGTNLISLATNGSERVRIDDSGNVGINTGSTTLGCRLQVVRGGTPVTPAAGATAYFQDLTNSSTSNCSLLLVGGNGTGGCNLFFGDTNNQLIGGIQYSNSNDSLGVRVNNAIRATFTSAGDLEVTGHISAGGVLRSGAYTVATLPTTGISTGAISYASNGRKSGEGSGSGTGVPVWFNGTNWRTYYDNLQVAS